MKKYLGKISFIDLEYLDEKFGLVISLDCNGCGTTDFIGGYVKNIEHTSITICTNIIQLMKDANVSNLQELKNKPIEVTFENNLLKEWRILTEVL